MKRLADQGRRPHRGYLAPCAVCGLIVVHAHSTREPFHMHRRSQLCRNLAEIAKTRAAKSLRRR